MLSVLPPYDLTASEYEGVVWGDVEGFFRNVECGAEGIVYDALCMKHLSISDYDLHGMFGHSVTLPGCV